MEISLTVIASVVCVVICILIRAQWQKAAVSLAGLVLAVQERIEADEKTIAEIKRGLDSQKQWEEHCKLLDEAFNRRFEQADKAHKLEVENMQSQIRLSLSAARDWEKVAENYGQAYSTLKRDMEEIKQCVPHG